MWENAASVPETANAPLKPLPSGENAAPHQEKRDENLVLWAQILLSVLLLAGIYAAKTARLPLYATLRTTYAALMQAPGPQPFAGERGFIKFTQESFASLRQATAEVFAELRSAAPDPGARAVRGRQATPAGVTLQSYQPAYRLAFPLRGVGCVSNSCYGWRTDPLTGQAHVFHTGDDLDAAQGTAVLAAAAGVVRFAGSHPSYGNYVRVLHVGGDETIYAHMQYLFVRGGQNVSAGQSLGTVGQTGDATGPHLHFELLHEGVRYDPAQALQSAG